MRTFQLSPSHSVLVGLSWRAYDTFESRHGQIVEWQSQGYSWSASYKFGSDSYVGLIDDSFERPMKGRLYSAAALVATHPKIKGKTALVMFAAGDDVALVGLLDGGVILDVASSAEDISLHRNSFAQRCAGKPFVTFGPADGGHFDESLEWADLIASGPLSSRLSKCKVTKFKSDRTAWIVVGVLSLFMLAGLAYLAKSHFDEKDKLRQQANRDMVNDPIRRYETAVQQFLADPKGVPVLGENVVKLRTLLGSVPISHGGWTLVKIICEMEAARCSAEWSIDGSKIGTYRSFVEAVPKLPANWSHVFGPSTGKVISSFPIEVSREKLQPKSAWPTYQAFLGGELSRWQSLYALGMNIELKEPVVQAVQGGMSPQYVENNPNAIHASGWSTTGAMWWHSEIFDKAPGNVTLERLIVVNNGKEITFNAEGKIYVQKM